MPTNDPFESGANPSITPASYFGQVTVDAWYVVLQKGVGKVPFDPQQHSLDKRVTALKISILPLPEQNITRDIYRELIAEFPEWYKIVLPTVKALGLPGDNALRALNGAWVHMTFQETGQTYQDKTTGETKNSTTLKFLAAYPDEAACRAAYLATQTDNGQTHEAPASAPTPIAYHNDHNGNGDKAKETAFKFLEAIVKQLNGDPVAVGAKIAAMPLISRYYTADSDEVAQLCMAWQMDNVPF